MLSALSAPAHPHRPLHLLQSNNATTNAWYGQRPADGHRENKGDQWYAPRPIPKVDAPPTPDKAVPGLLYPAHDCKDPNYKDDFRTRHYTQKALRRRFDPEKIVHPQAHIPEWGDYHWDEKDLRAEMSTHNAWTDITKDRFGK